MLHLNLWYFGKMKLRFIHTEQNLLNIFKTSFTVRLWIYFSYYPNIKHFLSHVECWTVAQCSKGRQEETSSPTLTKTAELWVGGRDQIQYAVYKYIIKYTAGAISVWDGEQRVKTKRTYTENTIKTDQQNIKEQHITINVNIIKLL